MGSMQYWSEQAKALTPYVAGEQPKVNNLIKLNTNENPYPPAPGVERAIRSAVGDLQYYPDPESTGLREALALHHGVDREQVFVGNGSDEVLAFAFLAFFAGRVLLAPALTYSFYPVYASLYGIDYRTVPMLADLSIDLAGLAQSQHVVLAHPNAPTSRAEKEQDLLALLDHCKQAGKLLLVDEAYGDFGPFSMVPYLQSHDNLLIVRTFSKSFSLAGLRVGACLGHPDLICALRRVKDSFNSYPLDRLAQAGAQAALADAAYYKNIKEKVKTTREDFAQKLREMGFCLPPSATNFVFARHPEMGGAALQQGLRARGILVRRFDRPEIADYLRISIGTPAHMDAVAQALQTILQLP